MSWFSWTHIGLLLVAAWLYRSFNQPTLKHWKGDDLPIIHPVYSCERGADPNNNWINTAGSEDVEISHKHNLAFITIGLRFPGLSDCFPDTEWKGVYVYNISSNTPPVELVLPSSNPHGLSLLEVDDDTVRLYIVSHPNRQGEGKEEIIFTDYNVKSKEVSNLKKLEHESLYSVNDLAVIDENNFVATNDHYFPPKTSSFLKKLELISTIGGTNVVHVKHKGDVVSKSTELFFGLNMANGVQYVNEQLLVTSPTAGQLVVLDWEFDSPKATLNRKLTFPKFAPDNVNVDKLGNIWLAGTSNTIRWLLQKEKIPSYVVKLNPKMDTMNVILADIEGDVVSHASVAAAYYATDDDFPKIIIGSPVYAPLFCSPT